MAPNKQQAIIWTNADLIHWRIYVALGGDGVEKENFHGIWIPQVVWYSTKFRLGV